MRKAIIVGSVGSLKATCAVVGAYFAARYLGYEIVGMAGASGGSIALPLLSKQMSMQEIKAALAGINGANIKDQDLTQQLIDKARQKLGLPKRKGDQPFTGLLRGNGLKAELKKLYASIGCSRISDGTIPFVVVASMIALSKDKVSQLDNPTTLFLAAVNANRRVVFKTGDTAAVVRASTAIPLVFRPESIDGDLYVDGGVLDSIPVLSASESFVWGEGVDFIVADASGEVVEEPVYSQDVDDIIAVAHATIATMVRDATLSNIKIVQTQLEAVGGRMIYLRPPVKIKMTETEKCPEQIDVAYNYALEIIKTYV